MKRLLLLFLCLPVFMQAQVLIPSSSLFNFGNVYENAPDSLQLTLTNTGSKTITVSDILFYDTYSQPAFSSSLSSFSIGPGGNQQIWIKFSPRHNILHNSEMVVINNSERGSVRIDLIGQGKYSNIYYNSTENLKEEALKTDLNSLLSSGYVQMGYNSARDEMFMVIDNKKENGQGASVNTIECVYTGRLVTNYANRTAAQNSPNDFNTEHTFPQSYFGSIEPMKSDIHHLYPTDMSSNSAHNNHPFAVITGSTTWAVGGSKATGFEFEPRDVQKGNTARAMLYFVTNYGDYASFFAPQETLLRQWHNDYPPTSIDTKRNDDIYSVQNNRNPYIDYPQFIERITLLAGASSEAPVYSLDQTEVLIDYDTVSLNTVETYCYTLVNDGNQALTLSNFNLDQTELSFAAGYGLNHTLQPGEATVLKIELFTNSLSPINGNLTFNTSNPSEPFISIPVLANPGGGLGSSIIISEIMYHPSDDPSLEYIELYNRSASAVDLNGYTFTAGINYTFGAQIINPGEFLVLAKNSAAMNLEFSYSTALQWTSGDLSNAGETIRLEDGSSGLVDECTYGTSAPWPLDAAGGGHSLILCDLNGNNDFGVNWNISTNFLNTVLSQQQYGSPGVGEVCVSDITPPTALNAWATSATEIKVVFSEPLDISSSTYPGSYAILQRVDNAVLGVVGDTVCLSLESPLSAGVDYQISIDNVADIAGNFMSAEASFSVSFGTAELKLVVSEIMYNPPEGGADSLEYLEIYNNGSSIVNLAGFKLVNAVNFTFPVHLMAPGEYVLIGGNPQALESDFGYIGAYEWSGALNNGATDTIILEDAGGAMLDSVKYGNGGIWPSVANGGGYSLILCDPESDNSDGNNWLPAINYVGILSGTPTYASPGEKNFCCIDQFEPNENSGQALALPAQGINGEAKLCANDEDWFSFNSTGFANAKTRLLCQAGDYDLEVYNSSMVLMGSSVNLGWDEEKVILNGIASGIYYIRVWSSSNDASDIGYCLKTTFSDAYIWDESFIDNSEQEFLVSPSPSPSNQSFNVQLPSTFSSGQLRVFNSLGSLVVNKQIKEQSNVAINPLPAGIYIIEWNSQGEIFQSRIVIQ